jgi:tetratricopeptide (TPR) repeat protein
MATARSRVRSRAGVGAEPPNRAENPVADDAKKPAAAQVSPSEKDLLPQDKDVLFQAQMAVANFFLGYYKYGLVVLGLVLLVALVYGIADSVHTSRQRDLHAKIAAVQNAVSDPSDEAALAKAAADLEAIAEKGGGTAAVMALLQAGEVFREAGKGDDALRAFEKAYALKPEGVLEWAAASGVAAEKVRKGDVDGALAIYRTFSSGDGAAAEEATWSLAVALEAAGKKDEARQAITDLMARFPSSRHLDEAAKAATRLGP